MEKQAVRVDLVELEDSQSTMRFVGVLTAGKLASDEMFGFTREWSTETGDYSLFPVVLASDNDAHTVYVAEWGSAGGDYNVEFRFVDRPLAVGQQIVRVDIVEGQPMESVYKIETIRSLLD